MSLLDTAMITVLSHALELTSQRQTLASQNIANIDTPGYHTRDIDFQQELARSLQAEQSSLGDQEISGPASTPMVHEVQGLIERPDGNNVNIDREGLLLAQNQLQFQTQVALLRSEFSRLQEAIQGGNGQ
jgi:flagellar basal-body rod protein FlgB